MTFLPGGELLVTERRGRLKLRRADGRVLEVGGVPQVSYGGQGGFGDVVLHPDFARNRLVYLSWVEAGDNGTRGAVVGRAHLNLSETGASLSDLQMIWRQQPKMDGGGHFSHRIAFGPDGRLYISSGERQHFDPAQDMSGNLGKVVRLNDDGSLPAGQSVRRAGRRRGAGLDARPPQSARPRLRRRPASSGKSRWVRRAATS